MSQASNLLLNLLLALLHAGGGTLVVAIRGTASAGDALTDLRCLCCFGTSLRPHTLVTTGALELKHLCFRTTLRPHTLVATGALQLKHLLSLQ